MDLDFILMKRIKNIKIQIFNSILGILLMKKDMAKGLCCIKIKLSMKETGKIINVKVLAN